MAVFGAGEVRARYRAAESDAVRTGCAGPAASGRCLSGRCLSGRCLGRRCPAPVRWTRPAGSRATGATVASNDLGALWTLGRWPIGGRGPIPRRRRGTVARVLATKRGLVVGRALALTRGWIARGWITRGLTGRRPVAGGRALRGPTPIRLGVVRRSVVHGSTVPKLASTAATQDGRVRRCNPRKRRCRSVRAR